MFHLALQGAKVYNSPEKTSLIIILLLILLSLIHKAILHEKSATNVYVKKISGVICPAAIHLQRPLPLRLLKRVFVFIAYINDIREQMQKGR